VSWVGLEVARWNDPTPTIGTAPTSAGRNGIATGGHGEPRTTAVLRGSLRERRRGRLSGRVPVLRPCGDLLQRERRCVSLDVILEGVLDVHRSTPRADRSLFHAVFDVVL
jgi:hypothetical protein